MSALLILGAQGDWEASDEEQAKFAADEAAKVDEVWSGIFGSADNSIVVPEDDAATATVASLIWNATMRALTASPCIGG